MLTLDCDRRIVQTMAATVAANNSKRQDIMNNGGILAMAIVAAVVAAIGAEAGYFEDYKAFAEAIISAVR